MFKRDVSPSSLGSQFPVPAAPVIFVCVFFVVGFFVFLFFWGEGGMYAIGFFFFSPWNFILQSIRTESAQSRCGLKRSFTPAACGRPYFCLRNVEVRTWLNIDPFLGLELIRLPTPSEWPLAGSTVGLSIGEWPVAGSIVGLSIGEWPLAWSIVGQSTG